MSGPDDYEVGYRKPPQHSRWRKGQSGNPNGPGKGRSDLTRAIQHELTRRITVTEDGRRKRITKCEAIAKQLDNRAVAGDAKAIPLILSEDRQHQVEAALAGQGGASWNSEADQKVMLGILQRLKGDDVGGEDEGNDQT